MFAVNHPHNFGNYIGLEELIYKKSYAVSVQLISSLYNRYK